MAVLLLLLLASAPEPPECHRATVYWETRAGWYRAQLAASDDVQIYLEAARALVPLLRALVDGRCATAQRAADTYREIMRLP